MDVPRSTCYSVYISQLIQFARVSSPVTDINTGNKILTSKLFYQGYRCHKLQRTFFQNFITDTMNWFQNLTLD